MSKKVNKINIYNRKASFEYIFIQEFEAGIVFLATEVKSLRQNQSANIADAYCYINKGEIFIKNMHIPMLKNAGNEQHDPLRERKLLLTKKKIRKIENELKNQGLTVVPIAMYTNSTGLVKMKIAISKGKKNFDKRNSIKEQDIKRDTDRTLKSI